MASSCTVVVFVNRFKTCQGGTAMKFTKWSKMIKKLTIFDFCHFQNYDQIAKKLLQEYPKHTEKHREAVPSGVFVVFLEFVWQFDGNFEDGEKSKIDNFHNGLFPCDS